MGGWKPGTNLDVNLRIQNCKCPDKNCKGATWSLNDGAARLARHSGHAHYKCDKCETRWSVAVGQAA